MASSQVKVLYRSRTNRILGGVCGGIGEYFNTDPTLIRLLWVIFTLAWGAGVLAYIIAWIIIPPKPLEVPSPATGSTVPPPPSPIGKISVFVGIFFIAIDLVILFRTLDVFPWSFWYAWHMTVGRFWPLVIVLIGLVLVAVRLQKRRFLIPVKISCWKRGETHRETFV